MQNKLLRLALLLISSIAAILLGFFLFSPEQSEALFREFGYWNIAILSISFATALVWGRKEEILSWTRRRESLVLVACCLVAAAFLFTREGSGFKIVFDEQLLANVARSLHIDHEPVFRESTLMDVARYEKIDKRPLLFPFLISLVHNVTGYQVENGFYLNFCLTALFLGLLYSLLNRLAGPKFGCYGFALACFMPLIEQNSSGGGFEMLNLCGILICAWLAISYWKSPDNLSLTRLVLGCALLSHIRYESAILAVPIAALVLLSWRKEKRIEIPWALVLAPLSFLPLAWQLAYIKTQPSYWQYSLEGGSSFDLSYLPINLQHAFNFLVIPNTRYAGSPLIGMLGLTGLVALIGFSITRARAFYHGKPERVAAVAVAAGLLAQTGLVLCFTFGQLDDNIVSRLGLPLVLLLICTGAILLGFLHDAHRNGKFAASILMVLVALYAFKMYSKVDYTDKNGTHKRIELALDFARNLPNGNYLFISSIPRVFELEEFNNLSIHNARKTVDRLARHKKLMTYDDIYVIQFGGLDWKDNGDLEASLMPYTELGPQFLLEPILERSYIAHNFTRISKIVGFELDADMTEFNKRSAPNGHSETDKKFKTLTPMELLEWTRSLP